MFQSRGETKFFERAGQLAPESQQALKRLRATHAPPEVRVEFGETIDGTMRIYARGASATSALLTFEGNGRLMLMIQFQRGNAAEGLLAVGRSLGWDPPGDWEKRKPTFQAGTWEHQTDALIRLIETS